MATPTIKGAASSTQLHVDAAQAPGVPPAVLERFAQTPSAKLNAYVGTLDPKTRDALPAAVDARAALQKPGQRFTFMDRSFQAAMADSQRDGNLPRVQSVRIHLTGSHQSLVVSSAGRSVNVPINVPPGFSISVQHDNSIMLNRADGKALRPPYHNDDTHNADHILLFPQVGRDGIVNFAYQAGEDNGAVSDLRGYLESLEAR